MLQMMYPLPFTVLWAPGMCYCLPDSHCHGNGLASQELEEGVWCFVISRLQIVGGVFERLIWRKNPSIAVSSAFGNRVLHMWSREYLHCSDGVKESYILMWCKECWDWSLNKTPLYFSLQPPFWGEPWRDTSPLCWWPALAMPWWDRRHIIEALRAC